MNIRTTIAASSALLAATLLLAACVPNGDPTGNPTSTPTPGETVIEVPETPVGGVIDAETAANLPDGYHGYPMPDGTFVVVAEDEPLPAPVQDKLNADMTSSSVTYGTSNTLSDGQHIAANNQAIAADIRDNTGKIPITVGYVYVDLTGNGGVMSWVVWVNLKGTVYSTRGEAEAAIAAVTASDPNAYAVAWTTV